MSHVGTKVGREERDDRNSKDVSKCRDNRNGGEGGHTCIVTLSGQLYCWGTAHNGVLSNLGRKTNAVNQQWDQVVPYLVGGPHSDQHVVQQSLIQHVPLSPFACWPKYDRCGPFVNVVASHDHCVATNDMGDLWGWGNGSGGRLGVERFLNMSGESKNGKTGGAKPPAVDRCKTILMGPHRVGVARESYWPGGDSLKNYQVLSVASGKQHMACIAVLKTNHHSKDRLPKTSPRGPWVPLGERVGYNDVTPPVKFEWSP